MTRTPSDAARDGGEGRRPEHATESEAVEAAKRVIAGAEGSEEGISLNDAEFVARALLSLSSRLETAREEMKEEAAKVADTMFNEHPFTMGYLVSSGVNTAKELAHRIRALSVK